MPKGRAARQAGRLPWRSGSIRLHGIRELLTCKKDQRSHARKPARRRSSRQASGAPLRQPHHAPHARGHHGRRPRRAPQAPDRSPLQAGDAVRRQVPHHRLRALELRQLRHPPHLDHDAVQGALADPAHPARLGLPARRVRRVRRGDPGAAADGQFLVSRHGRLALPEPADHPPAPPAARAGAGRRSHLQDGLRPDARLARGEARRHHRRRRRGAARAGDGVRRDERRRRLPHHQVLGEAEGARGHPRPRAVRARLDGHLRVQGEPAVPAARRGREAPGHQPRFRPQHHSRGARLAEGIRLSVHRHATRASSTTGATSAPSTPSTRRTWSWCTSIPSSTSTTRTGRSGPTSASTRRRSSCSTRMAGAAWR